MKQAELSVFLGVVYLTVVKWELNLKPISGKSGARVVAFLGYDPAASNAEPTGGSTTV